MPRRDYSKVAFAATGDTATIPDTTQPDGSVSLPQGFGFDYERDNGAGGGTPDPLAKNIEREDMNGILNEATASIGEIQQSGRPIWVATAAPYPINSEVRYSDDNIYRSSIANNNSEPGANADWVAQGSASPATTLVAGLIQLATNAQMEAGASASLVPSVAAVMSIFSKRVFGVNDYIRIPDVPGGFLLQWGSVTTGGTGVTATFATPFATVLCAVTNALQTADVNTTYQAPTNTGMFVQAYNQAGGLIAGTNVRYFAVGVSP